MSNYKDIVGTAVRNNAGNIPTAETGQVWFDSTNLDFKYQFPSLLSSWRTGNDLNTAKGYMGATKTGSQTASLVFGGTAPPETAITESWNGSSWTEVSDLNTARQGIAPAGASNTSALAFGGYPWTNDTESWNGSSWTEVNNLNTQRQDGAGFGSQTSAITAGGVVNPPGGDPGSASESWNGSSWTNTPSINTARRGIRGAGADNTNGIAMTGNPSGGGNTELWNGSSWTEVNDLNTTRTAGAAIGSYTAALSFGGETPGGTIANNEQWNGTSWTEVGDLSTARGALGSSSYGTTNSGLAFAGTPNSSVAEEWSANAPVGAWSTSTSLNTARNGIAGIGIYTAALAAGGNGPSPSPPTTAIVESWDGSSWTATPNLAEAGSRSGNGASSSAGLAYGDYPVTGVTEEFNKSINTITAGAWASGGSMGTTRFQAAGAGSQTAALAFGGETPGGDTANTEEYDGSSWSEQNNLPAVTKDHGGFGIQTAAVSCGGAPNTITYKYDGSSWTSSGALNTGRTNAGACGTQTAGLTFGGYPNITATEEFNGSSWTTNPNAMPESSQNRFGTGTQTAALAAYGGPPSFIKTTFEYDGSSWTSGGSGITERADARGGGTQTDAIAGGGYNPGYITSAEGYDGTAWSTRPSLSHAHAGGAAGQGAAPASANWISGGNPATNTTEEFTGETTSLNVKTLTQS